MKSRTMELATPGSGFSTCEEGRFAGNPDANDSAWDRIFSAVGFQLFGDGCFEGLLGVRAERLGIGRKGAERKGHQYEQGEEGKNAGVLDSGMDWHGARIVAYGERMFFTATPAIAQKARQGERPPRGW